MDTRGNIHTIPEEPEAKRVLERRVGKLVPIPADQLSAVKGMSLADRLAWRAREEAKADAALPEDERRKQRNAAKRLRRERRAK